MKGKEDNTDDTKRQGQHKDKHKYGQTWTRQTKMSVFGQSGPEGETITMRCM